MAVQYESGNSTVSARKTAASLRWYRFTLASAVLFACSAAFAKDPVELKEVPISAFLGKELRPRLPDSMLDIPIPVPAGYEQANFAKEPNSSYWMPAADIPGVNATGDLHTENGHMVAYISTSILYNKGQDIFRGVDDPESIAAVKKVFPDMQTRRYRTGDQAALVTQSSYNQVRGGGVFSTGPLTITSSTISGNAALDQEQYSSAKGGGIYAYDALTIQTSVITGNIARGYCYGGGLFARGLTTITRSTIDSNTACYEDGCVTSFTGEGGGIHAPYRNSASSALIIENSTISGNFAGRFGGGGFLGAKTTSIRSSTVAFNGSHESGGGVYTALKSSLALSSAIIADNSAANNSDLMVGGTLDPNSQKNLILFGNILPVSTIQLDPQLGPLADHGGTTARTRSTAPAPRSIRAALRRV